jgi:hypothetical protein
MMTRGATCVPCCYSKVPSLRCWPAVRAWQATNILFDRTLMLTSHRLRHYYQTLTVFVMAAVDLSHIA